MTEPNPAAPSPSPNGRAPVLLADTPGYPLARTVAMPERLPYRTGALSIRFGALEVHPEGEPEELSREPHGDRTRITYRIPALVLSGRYALDARPDALPELDTAGNLEPLSDAARQPTVPLAARTAAEAQAPPRQDVERWTARAREHRDKLMGTPHGGELVYRFNAHNEVYNELFGLPSVLRVWRGEEERAGLTREMAEHTFQCTDPAQEQSPPVNSWVHKDSHTKYNWQAFEVHHVLQATLSAKAQHAKQGNKTEQAAKYRAAFDSAAAFSKKVIKTGNDRNSTVPMDQHQIYQAVRNDDGTPPSSVEDAEFARYLRYVPLTAAMPVADAESDVPDRYVGSPHTTEPLADEPDYWEPLGARDYEVIRETTRALYQHEAEQQARQADGSGDLLHEGSCRARLVAPVFTLLLGPDGHAAPAEALSRLADARVELPPLELTLDGRGAWEGDAGRLAEERLNSMAFLPELLRESVLESVRFAALSGLPGFSPNGAGSR
ncbi:hypothetical protein ACFVGY_15740 [Streptomyces sp. NPDC127106]|uniref:hypothetical protein n=1 Tax=Streptomyces sp. NPDC127106 TaxID=3345360 RepID=UPI00363A631B